jgi:hypothetical protein
MSPENLGVDILQIGHAPSPIGFSTFKYIVGRYIFFLIVVFYYVHILGIQQIIKDVLMVLLFNVEVHRGGE